MKKDPRIDAHIASLSPAQREALQHIRALLHEVLPTAEETISYNMPCITVGGKGVAAFDAFKNHWSYFPMSGSVIGSVRGLPSFTEAAKGTLRVPLEKRLTKSIVSRLVVQRLREISAVVNGKRINFYSDGTVKAEGGMKDGEMHGAWTFTRRDGSVMRSGKFSMGVQVGVWRTFDSAGALVRETKFGGG